METMTLKMMNLSRHDLASVAVCTDKTAKSSAAECVDEIEAANNNLLGPGAECLDTSLSLIHI